MIRLSTIQKTAALEVFALVFVMSFPFLFFVNKAQAVGFTQIYIRFDRLASNTATTGMICAKPSSTLTTYRKLEVTFPDENSATDFVLGAASTFENTNVSTSSIDGNTAWPDITGATASKVGNVVTWTHTADQTLNSTNTYCFRWLNTTGTAVTTPTTAGASNLVGTIRALTSADAELMNSKYSTAIISSDQIVVSATVPPTFTFSLSGNTDSLGTLSSSSISSSSGRSVTIGTNASSGWIAWVKSANAALSSISTGGSIPTAGSIDNAVSDLDSVTGYVLDVDITTQGSQGSGNFTIEPEYDGDTTQGGTLSTTFQPVAVSDNPAGPTDGDVFTLIERAKITTVQAAATDYTDTLTVVAAGRF